MDKDNNDTSFAPSPAEWEVFPEQLVSILDAEPKQMRLVDCREQDEFEICRLEGAELIPLSQFGELAVPRLADESLPIVIYCHHGMRSLQATQFLRNRGVAAVWSLNGGIDRWSLEVDPEVRRY